MKRKSKILYWLTIGLFWAILIFVPSGKVYASDGWGKYGNFIQWYFYESTGLLEITGTGEMPEDDAPWYSYRNSIKKVVIGEGITSVSSGSFRNYYDLQKAVLPDSLRKIGEGAFRETGLTEITIPDNVSIIGSNCFYGCNSLRKAYIPDQVKIIPDWMFALCRNLEQARISPVTQSFGKYSFESTAITNMTIPRTATEIGEGAFNNTDLKSIEFPSTLQNIEQLVCFECNNLKYVKYDAQCPVPHMAFGLCGNLQTIKFSEGVTTIEYGAFSGMKKLSVYVPSSFRKFREGAFEADDVVFFGYPGTYAWEFAGENSNISFVDISSASGRNEWDFLWNATTATRLSEKNTKTTLFKSCYIYDGKVYTPSVQIKYKNDILQNGKDYILSYSAGRKNVGTYHVKILFKGIYTGKIYKKFTIIPQKLSSIKVNGKRSFLQLSWKNSKKQISGYQIQYSTSRNFVKKYTVNIRNYKDSSCKIRKLRAGIKYYIRARTYKTVKNKTYYSSWSSVQKG